MDHGESQVYLNGNFLPRSQAKLDIEDRGAMFADGVYEVVRYYAGHPFAIKEHLLRLQESLAAIRLPVPAGLDRLVTASNELVKRNGLTDAHVYWQVTRGSAPRHHAFGPDSTPTVIAITYPQPPLARESQPATIVAILVDDVRWHRCNVKSLMLLPNVLAKNQALDAGADEAIFHREGRITEGTATSVFIVRQGQLWTHPADQWILGGITRRTILRLSNTAGIPTFQRKFTVDEMLSADEIVVCGTTTHTAGVVKVNGKQIGNGSAGPVTMSLHSLLVKHICQTCTS